MNDTSRIPGPAALRQRRRVGRVAAVAAALLLVFWSSTGLVVVPADSIVAYERLGRLVAAPLEPGRHWLLPQPLGVIHRLGTRALRTVPIGFEGPWPGDGATALLWTRPHGPREYPRLCGTSTELVVFNAVLGYQIRTSGVGVRDFAAVARDPERLLVALAEELLSDDAAARSLDELLHTDRVVKSDTLRSRLQALADAERLGLDVVFFGVVSAHPPVDVAPAYLDVVNARIDADREARDARVKADGEMVRVAMMRDSAVADARAAASVRLTGVRVQADRAAALAELSRHGARSLRHRVECEEIGAFLADRALVLLDARLPRDVTVWFDDPSAPDRRPPDHVPAGAAPR
jgi:membrane protease subunit HflK